jgi:NADH-quinone oxidoreductase subunit N
MNNNYISEILLNYKLIKPEISLIICIFLNIFMLFLEKNKKSNISIFTSMLFTLIAIFFSFKNILFFQNQNIEFAQINLFKDLYVINKESSFLKMLIFIALFFIHYFSFFISERKNFINKFAIAEISILLNLSCLGAICAISSRNFISLYLSIELQAISSYMLVILKRNSSTSSEAALKYFVLGVISSSIMLFGISFIYFAFESFSFEQIYNNIISHKTHITGSDIIFSKLAMIGIVMLFFGLFFKLSAFPFHSWLPDLYQASSNIVVGFFAIIPKIMSAYIIFVLYHYVFLDKYFDINTKIISIISILSILVGSFSAIKQKNFKRILAYSGIANSGFILVAILGKSDFAINSMNIYFFSYIIAFFCLLCFAMFFWDENSDEKENCDISHIHGIAKKHKIISIMIAFSLFSIAGIPPFIGFFGKYQIIMSGFSNFQIIPIIIALFGSLVSLIYYLGLLKIMYFSNFNNKELNKNNRSNEYIKFILFFGIMTILSCGFLFFI